MGGYDAPAELSPEIHEKNLTQRGKEGKEAKKNGKNFTLCPFAYFRAFALKN
jgi:hypothetical protein